MYSLRNVLKLGAVFHALMHEVDERLKAQGVDIASRPIWAVGEVSKQYKISIPLAGPGETMPEDLAPYAPLSAAINAWYKEQYGERLLMEWCPGRTIALLDGDLYTIQIPRLFGSIEFVVSRKFLPNPEISRGPVTCNILQSVENLTQAKALRLSEQALEAANAAFHNALPALYTLESTSAELTHIARGDVAVAVNLLMDRGERFGESRWASLQAAEKALKAAISLAGAKFSQTHDLQRLEQEVSKAGVQLSADEQLRDLRCSAGVRYGQEHSTREQALRAHHASLSLVNALVAGGAKFNVGLG